MIFSAMATSVLGSQQNLQKKSTAFEIIDILSGIAPRLNQYTMSSSSVSTPEKSDIITWMDFENDRVLQCSSNPHLKNAKKFTDMSLYGDAELTIYMSPSQLWTDSLVKFAEFVKAAKGTGWIRSSSRSPAVDSPSTQLTSIARMDGRISSLTVQHSKQKQNNTLLTIVVDASGTCGCPKANLKCHWNNPLF